MRTYVMLIAGGALLSSLADMLAPEQWRKYIKTLTGIILLSLILSPISDILGSDIFAETLTAEEIEFTPMPLLVADELSESISKDIEERVAREFGVKSHAAAEIVTNDSGLIEKVGKITVFTDSEKISAIRSRLCEVYGVDYVEFREYGDFE